MSTTPDSSAPVLTPLGEPSPTGAARIPRFRAWPLWASLAGLLGFAGTVVFDVRPDAENEAFANGQEYVVTAADMLGLDQLAGRLGWTVGLLAVAALLVFQAAWRRHVEQHLRDSTAARVVTGGILATAATASLGYGWKGALANYLGPEAGLYDESGLFIYYLLTDFGAYLPWYGVTVASLAIAWMAFVERSISLPLGIVSALFGLGTVLAAFATGVPGLPGVYAPMWLTVAGLWLAFGRSRALAVPRG